MNNKSFSFRSTTSAGNAARINVIVDTNNETVVIEKIFTSTGNPFNLHVERRFSGYMVLIESIGFKESTMWNILRGLYDYNSTKHLKGIKP